MTEHDENEFMLSLDRRVSDQEEKISDTRRDYTELSHEIKELLNRINNGVSPSVNEVRKENSEIRLAIANLSHQIEIEKIEMKTVVRESAEHTRLMIENFDASKLSPVIREVGHIKKTFINGIVGAVIVAIGAKGINIIWDKVFIKETQMTSTK